ncbi:MAG: hypothetical protein MJZ30_07355 [Paludibacteraceae bacterium]|nr:hypothetical protein [Paludibacteraceae bacterium]
MLYKFTSPTCFPCKQVSLYFERKGIEHITVDVSTDEGMALAEKYGVRHTPTVIEIDPAGNVVTTLTKLPDILKL